MLVQESFSAGQRVVYRGTDGVAQDAIVVTVHHEVDGTPYYTIRPEGSNSERQTVAAKLRPRDA